MSDSEDDFMSDRFLVDVGSTSSSSKKGGGGGNGGIQKTYSEKRNIETLKSMRKGQLNNKIPLKQLEEQRRKEGLSTSLFDQQQQNSNSQGNGGNVAIGLMKKMGWNIGESLGKKRDIESSESLSPPSINSTTISGEEEPSRGGIGSGGSNSKSKRPKFLPGDELEELPKGGIGSSSRTNDDGGGRTEPIRISMWSGRKGLTARPVSPPPLPTNNFSNRNPDLLDEEKLKRLSRETNDFRERQRLEYGEKDKEKKCRAARDKLAGFDEEKGINFHPLHILPFSPLNTIPRPLLKMIYPSQVISPLSSPEPEPPQIGIGGYEKQSNLSAAEKIREQMRKDMLSSSSSSSNNLHINDDDEDYDGEDGIMKFGVMKNENSIEREEQGKKLEQIKIQEDKYQGVNWNEHVEGSKRVLSMDPSTYLQFVISQLRNEHLYCFWCSYKYNSFDEMESSGGCPGEDEDDH
ncbi:uncharacterized protein L201_006901 [Kwoniella dendrophila CBS 6074]|uniref:G-patch domain-containing protein n=1 Tax=Kwoniella dendrophila CBS 6074 TaxID=1295534 RepID=A0AAX4K3J9_9TREE